MVDVVVVVVAEVKKDHHHHHQQQQHDNNEDEDEDDGCGGGGGHPHTCSAALSLAAESLSPACCSRSWASSASRLSARFRCCWTSKCSSSVSTDAADADIGLTVMSAMSTSREPPWSDSTVRSCSVLVAASCGHAHT